MNKPLRILSLGAGVQSSTIALMIAEGEIEPVDCAVFADTGDEPRSVYDHLRWLMSDNVLPFPVHIVSKGKLGQEIRDAAAGVKINNYPRPPFFVRNKDGKAGMLRRQCTGDYKIDPIKRKVRELLGAPPRRQPPKGARAIQLIGISLDEIARCKPSSVRYISHEWPLIDRGMRRWDCLRWLDRKGYPRPPKSACTFCPYRSDAEWRRMRDEDPRSWQEAIEMDRLIRHNMPRVMEGPVYLHRSLRPLDEVDLDVQEPPSLFGEGGWANECEGMCGL